MTGSLIQILVELPTVLLVLLKVSLVLALSWVLHFALLRSNPRWRVVLWRAMAVGVLLVPFLGLVMPAFKLAVPHRALQPLTVTDMGNSIPLTAPESAAIRPLLHTPVNIQPDQPLQQSFFIAVREHPWLSLAIVWTVVCALLVGKVLNNLRNINRLLVSSAPVDGRIKEVFAVTRESMSVSCAVELRASNTISSPFLYGVRRPVIILPERMTQNDYAGELPAIFAHELAHLKNNDLAWMNLIHAVSIALWFHPLVWRVAAENASACEAVCDSVAAGHVGGPLVYSRTLAKIALERIAPMPAVGGIAMARLPEVRQRLNTLKMKIDGGPLARRRVAVTIATGFSIISILAGIRLVSAGEAVSQEKLAETNVKAAEDSKISHDSKGLKGIFFLEDAENGKTLAHDPDAEKLLNSLLPAIKNAPQYKLPLTFDADAQCYYITGLNQVSKEPHELVTSHFSRDKEHASILQTVKLINAEKGNHQQIHLFLIDGENGFMDDRTSLEPASLVNAFCRDIAAGKNPLLSNQYCGGFAEGAFLNQSNDWISQLDDASEIFVSKAKKNIDDHLCWGIRSITPRGKFEFWVDPEAGFNIRRASIKVEGNDLYLGKPISQKKFPPPVNLRWEAIGFATRDIVIEKMGDNYLPIAGTLSTTWYLEGGKIDGGKTTFKRTNIKFSPDSEFLKLDWPEGTKALGLGKYKNQTFIWKQGRIEILPPGAGSITKLPTSSNE